jgi:hypothetical protein
MPKTSSSFDPSAYATVADRITLFYERYPDGRIETDLISRENGAVTFKALVYRAVAERAPAATGWASEREDDGEINSVACLENTETSAIGRALANLGFTASLKRPSREEMEKTERERRRNARPVGVAGGSVPDARLAASTELQVHADAAHDLLDLLQAAEGHGFSHSRAAVIRSRANQVPPLPLGRVSKLEALVRAWLRRTDV